MGNSGRYLAITVAVIAIFAVADTMWLPYSTVYLPDGSFVDPAKIAVLLGVLYSAGWIVAHRLRNDEAAGARIIRRVAEILKSTTLAGGLFAALTIAGCIFMYLGTATSRPFVDRELAAFDASVGFDWLGFLAALNAWPTVAKVMVFCYGETGHLLVFTFVALILSREGPFEYLALLAITALAGAIVMAIFPSAGAYAFHMPRAETFSNFTGIGGLWHLDTLEALRSGEPYEYERTATMGLVSFPSYHAVLGVIMTYCLRRYVWLAIPVGIVNAVMLVATMPEGGHHLSDTLVGVTLAVVSILLIRRPFTIGQVTSCQPAPNV